MTDKITIERETMERAIRWHESRIWPGPDEVAVFGALRAALAQQAEPPAPAAVPLTDEQIGALWDNHIVPVFGKNGINPIVFAGAIERAHGIAAAGEKPCSD